MACSLKKNLPLLGCLLLPGGVQAQPLPLFGAADRFDLLEASNWKSGEVEGRLCLILDTPGVQRPPVRRPSEYALIKGDESISGFKVEAITLQPDAIINRDICLIFGYRDDTHFYYAHISSNSDNTFHNVIMRVGGDRRERINLETDPEARLSGAWTEISVQHSASGEIKVFVGDPTTPLMTAHDTTYPVGRAGFGSFDDRAAFAMLWLD